MTTITAMTQPMRSRSHILVPSLWAAALLLVAYLGAPGRAVDSLIDALMASEALHDPATFTHALLIGIPVMLFLAIAVSAAAFHD